MAFVKLVKNKAYFKRFQVKYRRRREGKTDYHARSGLLNQEKSKYDAKKYRFIVRISNTRIICQVAYSTIKGDVIVCSAESSELPNYGINFGLTNYAAAYATGLLCSRRLLKKYNIDKQFLGKEVADGAEYHVEEECDAENRRPFKCVLDIGIVRTTTGNRVFGAMKGACDGGIHIPHSEIRFAGFTGKKKEGEYNAEKHRERIMGVHVGRYMKEMMEESPDKYESHFSRFIKAGINPDDIENLYKKCHSLIRANPARKVSDKKKTDSQSSMRQGSTIKTAKGSYVRHKKLTCEQRKERVMKKMAMVAEKMNEDN